MPARQYHESDGELWGEIERFPSYRVSTEGRVVNIRTGVFLKPQHRGMFYPLRLKLRTNGDYATCSVHRLVAEAFLSGFSPRVQVGFKNDDYHDPRLLNLTIQTGIGQFLGGSETVPIRRVFSSEGIMYANAYEAAQDLQCHISEMQDVLREVRGGIRGVSCWYEWVEGVFDGTRFVPWASESIIQPGLW